MWKVQLSSAPGAPMAAAQARLGVSRGLLLGSPQPSCGRGAALPQGVHHLAPVREREREGPVSCCNVTHSAAIIPGFLARKERVSLGWLFLCCIYPKISLAPSAVLFQEPWDAVCTSTPGTQLCFP